MGMRSHTRNLVAWKPSAGPADRYGAPRFMPVTRPRRVRWWIRTGAMFSVVGIRRLARLMRARWRPMFLIAGATLTVIGVVVPGSMVFVPGVLVLLFVVLKGNGAPSHCQSAAQMTGVRWRG
jgi:hypothetical protein